MLSRRLVSATDWVRHDPAIGGLPIGYFGASTGSAVALVVAVARSQDVKAVVSRGGRTDLADSVLSAVRAPTLPIVGGADKNVLFLNQGSLARLPCDKQLLVVPGAGHLFAEPGALEAVARLASQWFDRYLNANDAALSLTDSDG